jgi:dGTP triphosphohydrolase
LNDGKERKVADYIAGMTDQYASRLAEEISR